jgi:hypothetical protein
MAKPLSPQDVDLYEVLEPKHCRAICEEISERLRPSLARDTSPIPMPLRDLVDRIAELEGAAPPIIPDCVEEPLARERPKRGLRFLLFS